MGQYFKGTDLVPVVAGTTRVGIMDYIRRNRDAFETPRDHKKEAYTAAGLGLYNTIITLGVAFAAAAGATKGIEILLK